MFRVQWMSLAFGVFRGDTIEVSERRTRAEEVEEERKEKMHMTLTGDRRGGCWERKKASKSRQGYEMSNQSSDQDFQSQLKTQCIAEHHSCWGRL